MRRTTTITLGLAFVLAGCGGSSSSDGSIPIKKIALPTRTITYSVPSSSMEPTLRCAMPNVGCEATVSDGAVTQLPARDLKLKDVIAFRTPPKAREVCGAGGIFLKRILGMPGDRWEERQGYVYVNGKKLDEPYVTADHRDLRTIGPITIPADAYYVLGDNRSSSCDSRSWGPVPAANVIGKVVQIIRPK
jgi:signal peptidase I